MCNFKSKSVKERQCCYCAIIFTVCFLTSLALIIGGFLVPPMGVIDGSVLTAVGELFAFPALLYGYRAVELGLEVKLSHGDTSLEIGKGETA